MTEHSLNLHQASAALTDLRWLVRYARHCRLPIPPSQPTEQTLRVAFGKGAWRIVCLSPKACFLPILRNQQLSIHSLIDYCQKLAEHSFVCAPQALLLDYFVTQRRLYYDHPCRIPQDGDYALMRVASREPHPRIADIALVCQWIHDSHYTIRSNQNWSALVRKASRIRESERAALAASKESAWHFYCKSMNWRGYRIEPLTDSAALYSEARSMGSCVYKLRRDCDGLKPSRFFSVKRSGKRVATLELAWSHPQQEFVGMDRQWGRWSLHDLRLSYNRLPGKDLSNAMQGFAQMYNLWAKRPARMQPSELDDLQDRIARINGHWRWQASSHFSSH